MEYFVIMVGEFLGLQQVKECCPFSEDLAIRLRQYCFINVMVSSLTRLDSYIGRLSYLFLTFLHISKYLWYDQRSLNLDLHRQS